MSCSVLGIVMSSDGVKESDELDFRAGCFPLLDFESFLLLLDSVVSFRFGVDVVGCCFEVVGVGVICCCVVFCSGVIGAGVVGFCVTVDGVVGAGVIVVDGVVGAGVVVGIAEVDGFVCGGSQVFFCPATVLNDLSSIVCLFCTILPRVNK